MTDSAGIISFAIVSPLCPLNAFDIADDQLRLPVDQDRQQPLPELPGRTLVEWRNQRLQ
jgi:hypothetical protein